MSAEVQELTHARLEPAIAGFPGLFAARTVGADVLDARYQLGDVELRMLAAHRPRPVDLMALVVLVALAGPAGRASDDGDGDRQLVDALAAAADGVLIVETRVARVLHEIGLEDGGSGRAQLRESLARLAGLTVIGRRGTREVSMHLLSYAVDESTGALQVALSPRLTAAILGGRHIRLELPELRALGEHARVLYCRLCVWIDPGRARRAGINVIVGYLWPEPTRGPAVMRKRLHLARAALAELGQLDGWRIEADGRRLLYTIARPAGKTGTRVGISGTLPAKQERRKMRFLRRLMWLAQLFIGHP